MSYSDSTTKIKGRLEQAQQLSDERGECTREDLAVALGVSKITVAAWIRTAHREGLPVRKRLVRQGKRGPKAHAYYLGEVK